MTIIKPIVFGSLILAALSVTQTDAFARFEHHGHGGDFAAAESRAREIPHANDASKLHTVLKHPEEINSSAVKSELKAHGPEIVTIQGRVHEDVVGAAHPESKVQQDQKKSKAMTSCGKDPTGPGC